MFAEHINAVSCRIEDGRDLKTGRAARLLPDSLWLLAPRALTCTCHGYLCMAVTPRVGFVLCKDVLLISVDNHF